MPPEETKDTKDTPPVETKTKPATEKPAEKTVPESELHRLLSEERDRIQKETRSAVLKELDDRLLPDDLLKSLEIKSVKDLIALLKEAEDEEAGDKKQSGKKKKDAGAEESEEVKSLRAKFESELENREKELADRQKRQDELSALLQKERVDNALLGELKGRGVHSPDLIVMALKNAVKLDKDLNPIVVNAEGQPRVKTIESTQDGVRKFATIDMTLAHLVDEFLSDEGNAHFLPASSREGSGARGKGPTVGNTSIEATYQHEFDEAVKRGRITPGFIRAQAQKFKNADRV